MEETQFENLVSPTLWLQASPEVRNLIAKEFGMERSTSPRCVNELGHTRIESDGFTVDDLRALNVISLQQWMGFTNVDPQADLFALFKMCVNRAQEMITRGLSTPPVEGQIIQPAVDPVSTPQDPPAPATESKPFCDTCDSKGVRHKKTCPKFK